MLVSVYGFAQQTIVNGNITDAETARAVSSVSITFANTHIGTSTDSLGKFSLFAPGSFSRIVISAVGYQPLTRIITPGTENQLHIKLEKSSMLLKEVAITARNAKRYRNKDNPAVELIRRVIAHKDSNRIQSANYIQYDQYERVGLSLFNIPPPLVNNFVFRPYKFMLDTVDGKLSAQVYMSERRYKQYLSKDPERSIKILEAQKESNILKFIDTAGINLYINRLYGNKVDIYENNILIINRQLLSPIADHSPDFYKFFITDTIRSGKDTLVELSFIPRNKGDLLFEGRLLVTLNGRYAVASCELNVNSQINLNFLRSLKVILDFERRTDGRYLLIKSDAKADFGVLKNKGFGMTGERSIFYSNYVVDKPLDLAFYQGRSEQTLPGFDKQDSAYWVQQRPDTLPEKEVVFYRRVGRLEKMRSYRIVTKVASAMVDGYADLGPFQFNTGDLIGRSSLEGLRLGLGGRTTPKFNKTVYLEGYAAYGMRDHQMKHNAIVYYSFNQTAPYRYPNNYLKISQQYDTSLPGDNFTNGNFRTPVSSSLQTGSNSYYFYTHSFKVDYVKEFDNHFSFDIGFSNRSQQAAGSLTYTLNDPQQTVVDHITTSLITLSLRYAPHEQLYQRAVGRHSIRNQYPIFTLLASQSLNNVLGGSINYNSFTGTIAKRFFLSQLGFADMTLVGGLIVGKVPFPLLNISPANQSLVYERNSYNEMHYLEFVSDHYVGINITQSFNGFFLNKIPLINRLKLREFLSFKTLYGGLRAENNPALTGGLYNFPTPTNGATGTYALGSQPYTEAGVGIGNIFKLLRLDGIRRFNYLDHPGVSKYGIKFTVSIDL